MAKKIEKTVKTKEDYSPEQQAAFKAGARREKAKQKRKQAAALGKLFN